MMKLWLIQRTDDIGYDEFSGAVMAAIDETEAVRLSPVAGHKNLRVRHIGEAAPDLEQGAVLTDFNAG